MNKTFDVFLFCLLILNNSQSTLYNMFVNVKYGKQQSQTSIIYTNMPILAFVQRFSDQGDVNSRLARYYNIISDNNNNAVLNKCETTRPCRPEVGNHLNSIGLLGWKSKLHVRRRYLSVIQLYRSNFVGIDFFLTVCYNIE